MEFLFDFMSQNPKISAAFTAVGALYTALSAMATITPTNKDDNAMGKVGRFFDRVGFNVNWKKKF